MKALLLSVVFCVVHLTSFAQFEKINGLDKSEFKKITVLKDAGSIYSATSNFIFKTTDKGKSWQKIFTAKDDVIKDFIIDSYLDETIYVLTARCLYKIYNKNREKVFNFAPEVEGVKLVQFKGLLYCATTDGLYFSYHDNLKLKRFKDLLLENIVEIKCEEKALYVVTNQALYVSFDKINFQKTFILKNIDNDENDIGVYDLSVNLLINNDDSSIIYLAVNDSVYLSYNRGLDWKTLPVVGIKGANIYCLKQTKMDDFLYAATDKGIICINLKNYTTNKIFEGLESNCVYGIDFDKEGRLYAATSKGVFVNNYFTQSESSIMVKKVIDNMPEFIDVVKEALCYNSVSPEKIKRWSNRLKLRGLFPKISLDYDRTVNYDSGSDCYYVGPQDWGIGLSWDVADLIWNSYEDDVDTRSRLLTQLRINIVDDIRVIYFERVRIQLKSINNNFESEEERIKNELRLKELTAALDGYTGGWFSRQIK